MGLNRYITTDGAEEAASEAQNRLHESGMRLGDGILDWFIMDIERAN